MGAHKEVFEGLQEGVLVGGLPHKTNCECLSCSNYNLSLPTLTRTPCKPLTMGEYAGPALFLGDG